MQDRKNRLADGYSILRELFESEDENLNLDQLFKRKLRQLKMSQTEAQKFLKIERRALTGILTGTQKIIDASNFIKIAAFLQMPKEKVAALYLNALNVHTPVEDYETEKVKFIQEHFDLVPLKKAGTISTLTNFDVIEQELCFFLGLKSIFEYVPENVPVAFSSGLIQPQSDNTRVLWKGNAKSIFKKIGNPNAYDREGLMKYFPKIRWQSTNVEMGLMSVIQDLYGLGITVIYQPPFQSLHLRGATMCINNKPCVVLTNYVGFYATLWFALIHELYHVLFDWQEISSGKYHMSEDDITELSIVEKENKANDFAREYLFSKQKSHEVKPFLNDHAFISEYAERDFIHHSIIYTFAAFDANKADKWAWSRAKKYGPKNPTDSVKKFHDIYQEFRAVGDRAIHIKTEIFN